MHYVFGDKTFENFNEAKNFIQQYKKEQEQEEQSEIKPETKPKLSAEEREKIVKDFYKLSPKEREEKIKKFDADELFENSEELSEPLYETISGGGGYSGYSMSNRAKESYESGQKPISKWTKDDIIDTCMSVSELDGLQEYLQNTSAKELKENLLQYSGWHHTSKYYNQTAFYGVRSPKEIYEFLKDKYGKLS